MGDATGAEEDDATGGAVSMARSVWDGCKGAEDEDATGDCMAGDGWEQERQQRGEQLFWLARAVQVPIKSRPGKPLR